MKSIFKAIVLSTLLGVANAQQGTQQSGANCNVVATVQCAFGEEDCIVLEDMKCDFFRTLTFTYKYCNQNADSVVFIERRTEAKLNSTVVSDAGSRFDKSIITSSSCRTVKIKETFDTCAIGSTAASMKLEGWIVDRQQVDSYYCYGWDHISVKLRKDEAIPVVTPTASPVKRHTASPVKDVIDPPVNPDISMTITCDFLDSGIYVPCSNLPWYTAAADGSDCVRLFKFTYTIYNNHYSAVLLQGLIDESTNSNLLDADAMGLSIGYRGHYSVVKTESIDICRLNGSTVTKQAVAVAAGIPDFYPGTAIDTYALFIP